ncbi:MAG: hypothetical protein AAFW46_19610, partial [Pseudomonadota bacterium]
MGRLANLGRRASRLSPASRITCIAPSLFADGVAPGGRAGKAAFRRVVACAGAAGCHATAHATTRRNAALPARPPGATPSANREGAMQVIRDAGESRLALDRTPQPP